MRIIGCPHNCNGASDAGYKSGWASAEFLRKSIIEFNLFLEKKENIAFLEFLSNIKFNEDFIRSQCVSILSRLHWLDKTQFRNFMKDLVDNRNVSFLLSFFHSYLGFCSEASNPFSPNPNVIPMSRKKSPSRQGTDLSPIGYQNNFGETMGNYLLQKKTNLNNHFTKGSGTKEGVQSETIKITFKKFVTKLMKNVGFLYSILHT